MQASSYLSWAPVVMCNAISELNCKSLHTSANSFVFICVHLFQLCSVQRLSCIGFG